MTISKLNVFAEECSDETRVLGGVGNADGVVGDVNVGDIGGVGDGERLNGLGNDTEELLGDGRRQHWVGVLPESWDS